ncbi:arylsulfatase B [Aplysia californica]|uniref:Arylsulfatase B n=1 Tax=Aplysia californica TaxID=6500 RepID=A0ABM0JRD4_APLCA|nr:arylsulfatase B [Aplysia californica]
MATALLMTVAAVLSVALGAEKPNVIFIVADDLGWNDVGYTNPDVISPNIDFLAKSGVILDQYYVQPLCSPSRTAFMTGVYPYRLGLQHLVVMNNQDVCVPLDRKMLPQLLKENGYSTHMMGKWHLGFCKWECTPTYRGFDSFYGFYSGGEDHYSKEVNGFDFRNNTEVCRDGAKNYSTYQYADRMEQIVRGHDPKNPLFMYMAFQNVHMPMQVPEKYTAMYPHIQNENRKYLSAMVTAVDDAIGRLITSLKQKGIYNNTLIIFTSDNGGWTSYGGNNYPLRGGKISIFEGGTRVVGFLHGPMLARKGGKFDGLMHAVDWFPTIAEAAGIQNKEPDQDGMSQWSAINSRGPALRQEVVYNLDYHSLPLQGQAAIRVGDYKLIEGFPGMYEGWYKPDTVYKEPLGNLTLDLNNLPKLNIGEDFHVFKYLFNLKDDPTEHNNLYDKLPDVVKMMEGKLEAAKKRYVAPNFPSADPKSNPQNYGGVWTPGWC